MFKQILKALFLGWVTKQIARRGARRSGNYRY